MKLIVTYYGEHGDVLHQDVRESPVDYDSIEIDIPRDVEVESLAGGKVKIAAKTVKVQVLSTMKPGERIADELGKYVLAVIKHYEQAQAINHCEGCEHHQGGNPRGRETARLQRSP